MGWAGRLDGEFRQSADAFEWFNAERKCRTCGRVLPVDGDRRVKYCSAPCRKKGKTKGNTLRAWRWRQKKLEARIHEIHFKPGIESLWEQRRRLKEERAILEISIGDMEAELGLPELREILGERMEQAERKDRMMAEWTAEQEARRCVHPKIVNRGDTPDSLACNICGADARTVVEDDWRAEQMLVEWLRTRPEPMRAVCPLKGRKALRGHTTAMLCPEPHCGDVFRSSETFYAGRCWTQLEALEKALAPPAPESVIFPLYEAPAKKQSTMDLTGVASVDLH